MLVGDHRQLDAVGPGGALAALLRQRSELVVTLDGNVRQRDPAERRALAGLRAGSVPKAVAWFARNDRVQVQSSRVDTLVAMTDAWSTDLAAGHDTALLAWRRQDVADLNRLARGHWDKLGRLTGDDVKVNGGRSYASGDRPVALAPNPQAGIVTSEPLRAVEVDRDLMVVRTAAGREVTITGEGLDSDHLDYGYALTIHRSQGATYDRSHVLAAGGGRELGYVAMSRARGGTTIHATADDLAQAVDDLQADWGVARHQRWITDTHAQPGRHPIPARFRHARPPAPVQELPRRSATELVREAQRRVVDLYRDLDDLRAGTGDWADTPAGHAGRTLDDADRRLIEARRLADDPDARRRDRRAATKAIPQLEAATEAAQHDWNEHGAPEELQLQRQAAAARREIAKLTPAANAEHLERIQARSAERAAGLDRGSSLGL